MAYLEPAEINTHLYGEIVNEISRADATILQAAIDAAISEMRGYISFFDVDTILAATGTGREPILLLFTKDIAVWHFISLANPNVEMEYRETRYNNAIKWLRSVQKGETVPNLPPATNPDETVQTGKVKFGSNTKRQTSY